MKHHVFTAFDMQVWLKKFHFGMVRTSYWWLKPQVCKPRMPFFSSKLPMLLKKIHVMDILYTGTYGLFYLIIESLTVDRWNLSFPQQIHLCFSPFLCNSQLLIHSVTWRFAFPFYLMLRFGMVLVMVIVTSDLLDGLFYWINLNQYTLVGLCKSTLYIIRLVLFHESLVWCKYKVEPLLNSLSEN